MACITARLPQCTLHVLFLLTGSKAKIVSVQIEPCHSDPCVLKKGTKVKLHFKMISGEFSSMLTFFLCITKQPFLTELLMKGGSIYSVRSVGKGVCERLSE